MEKWSLNSHKIETYHMVLDGELIENITKKTHERSKFSHNSDTVTIPRYFYRFIGIQNDEDEYYNYLYDIGEEFEKRYPKLFLKVVHGLEENIDQKLLNKMYMIWDKLTSFGDITSQIVLNLLETENVLIHFPTDTLNRQIRLNLEGLIEYYFDVNNHEIDANDFQRFLFYMIYWINCYVEQLFINFDYTQYNPKVLFYGDISKEEIYFLIYLSSLGCDILYFNPKSDCDFWLVDNNNDFSYKQNLGAKSTLEPFPTVKKLTRASTVAHSASKQIDNVIHTEDSGHYKSWQFMEYNTQAVTLKTTYDEVLILGKEKALIRPQWEVKNRTVFIPNLFAKVNGVHENVNQYWKELHTLVEQENTLFFKHLPISKQTNEKRYSEYWACLDDNKRLNEEKMLKSDWWPYKYLPTGMQKVVANRISELCHKPRMKLNQSRPYEDFQVEIFSNLLDMEDKFVKLIQKFDYPQEVPKVVIYNYEHNGDLSFHDAIVLSFLNSIGIDIVIFNPSGYNDVENYIENKWFDVHRLKDITFELTYKEKGFFNRFFS